MSNQEKLEHQRALKDLEKQTTTLTSLKEEKDRIEEELKVWHVGGRWESNIVFSTCN